jgi:wyosine [tRNA(Phe)-imidazoG37] synthetase (radical SAM superfamily)
VYCEVDRITPPRALRIDPARLREELLLTLRDVKAGKLAQMPKFRDAPELAQEVKDIAFSGDGEPTMIPNFAECVQVVAEVKRSEGLDKAKIVLITDAAGLDKADVKRGLEIMDANQGQIWGKLDAGTEGHYKAVNRSAVQFERILKNLLATGRVRPIVIQSLFLKLHGQIMPAEELDAYCQRLNDLVQGGAKILEVHAYTVARPTPETFATRLEASELNGIAEQIRQRTGLTVSAFE